MSTMCQELSTGEWGEQTGDVLQLWCSPSDRRTGQQIKTLRVKCSGDRRGVKGDGGTSFGVRCEGALYSPECSKVPAKPLSGGRTFQAENCSPEVLMGSQHTDWASYDPRRWGEKTVQPVNLQDTCVPNALHSL